MHTSWCATFELITIAIQYLPSELAWNCETLPVFTESEMSGTVVIDMPTYLFSRLIMSNKISTIPRASQFDSDWWW